MRHVRLAATPWGEVYMLYDDTDDEDDDADDDTDDVDEDTDDYTDDVDQDQDDDLMMLMMAILMMI